MYQKLVDLWQRFTRESEEWEYFRYLQNHPDRCNFIKDMSKAELAEELHRWHLRSDLQAQSLHMVSKLTHVQSDTINELRSQINFQELLLKDMLEEVNYYKNPYRLK